MNKNEKYNILKENADSKPMICVDFYYINKESNGKKKTTAIGIFDGFDKGNLLLSSGMEIPLTDIISIKGDIFCK